MTLEDLGNLGDFLGGLAVIATLLYLAVQIRQSTAAIRISAERGADPVSAMSLITQSPANAATYHQGLRDSQQLDSEQRTLFYLLMAAQFYSIHSGFRAFELGTQSEDTWKWQSKALKFYASQIGVKRWWVHQGKNLFEAGSSFYQLVGKEMGKSESQQNQ